MVGKRLGKGDCERVSQPPGKGVGQRGTSWRLIRRRRTGSEPMHQADALNDPAGGLHASCRPEALRGTSGTELPQAGLSCHRRDPWTCGGGCQPRCGWPRTFRFRRRLVQPLNAARTFWKTAPATTTVRTSGRPCSDHGAEYPTSGTAGSQHTPPTKPRTSDAIACSATNHCCRQRRAQHEGYEDQRRG